MMEIRPQEVNRKCTNFVWLLIFIFLPFLLISQVQRLQKESFSHLKLDNSDGYIIDDLNAMDFDEDGWLWLSGIKNESRNFQLGAKDIVLLRFNGQQFYEVDIPKEVLDGATKLTIKKAFENFFYILVSSRDNPRMYKLDPRSMIFSDVELPKDKGSENSRFSVFKLKEGFLFIQESDEGNRLYSLDENDNFKQLGRMKTNVNIGGSSVLEFDGKILISKFNFGSEVFSWNGDSLINIDIRSSDYFSKDSKVKYGFSTIDEDYVLLVDDPQIYSYNEDLETFEPTLAFCCKDGFVERFYYTDGKGNHLLTKSIGQESLLEIFENEYEQPIWTYGMQNAVSDLPRFASRDLHQELILGNNGVLKVYIFNPDPVHTFLEEKSIRSLLQINEEEILVSTDFSGWYILNLTSYDIEPFYPVLEGVKLKPVLNRDIVIENGVIWSNDGRSIIKVDMSSGETRVFQFSNNLAAVSHRGDRIYIADEVRSVITFDKKSQEIKTVIEKDSVGYENLYSEDDFIYGATSLGLRIFSEDSIYLLKPGNRREDNYLVSISEFKEDKLLVGSRSGKLYEFDVNQKTFRTIYNDALEASIASILLDDRDRIWLNTFAGIVCYDSITGKNYRFGLNDGLSNYEANRFSALKLHNGDFLVGTVKGLNYFNPDSLLASYSKSNFQHKLQLISIEKYDKKQKQNVTILSRDELENTTSITLPAQNRNATINFGVVKPRIDITYLFKYRLGSSDWLTIENGNEIQLLNLQSGKYDLEIQALDKSKNEILASLTTAVIVKQHFYNSIWFYFLVLILVLAGVLVYTYKWQEVNQANYKNKLLKSEIEFKKKDLADFATNISRNQQWNDYLLGKMEEISNAKGRKKGAAFVNLQNEIKAKNAVLESNFEFQKRVELLNNEFYNSLLNQYPTLSKTDLKLCSLIRLSLDNYDIAALQNIDISSVYTGRYRLRKKLGITSDTDLDAFLKAF